jgi:hypothetical protein
MIGYASDLGISKPNGTILLAIMNGQSGNNTFNPNQTLAL